MLPAPESFEGDLGDLFAQAIEPNLPPPAEVQHWHHRIVEFCQREDSVFAVRQISATERGSIYTTVSGQKLKPSDNSPAWWMHFVAFQRDP